MQQQERFTAGEAADFLRVSSSTIADLQALEMQIREMLHRGRSTVNLLRGLARSERNRRAGVEIRAVIAELREASREIVQLRRELTSANVAPAQSALLTRIEGRSVGWRALLARADDLIAAVSAEAAGDAPRLQHNGLFHDRPEWMDVRTRAD